MIKHSYLNDYSEGAHPKILDALLRTNMVQELGYGEDSYCREASELIRGAVGNPQADVHFLSGGTQTNLTALSSFLKPFESVIAVDSGHICVHEAGAIEATGHKINLVTGHDGKVLAEEIEAVVAAHTDEHMVRPRTVFISHSSELGTIYSKKELEAIASVCRKHNLYLYLDGARLGSALMSRHADISLKEISALVDIFYIGGTKNGALLGEALVINNESLKTDFRYSLKQKGALLSKGRILGIQFLELFRDGLFFDLAANANEMAEKMTAGISRLGYPFQTPSQTNQIFPIFPNKVIEAMNASYQFYTWAKVDEQRSSVRLVTSWAAAPQDIDEFITDLGTISGNYSAGKQ